MWCRGVLVALLVAVAANATPAFAQLGLGGLTSDIWQSGTQPTPNLYVARQTPGVQPAAPGGPVPNQAAPGSWPSWYAPPPGMPFAGGTLVTGLTVGALFDDNIFATNTNRMSDWAAFERPEFAWVRQGPNYTFSSDGSLEAREYARFSSEDQVNGNIGAGFTVMPDNDTQVIGGVRYIHSHLDRGSSETIVPGSTQLLSTTFQHPVAYDEGLQSLTLNHRNGNWWTSIGAAGLEIEYQNPTIALTGTTVDLGYADGTIGAVHARLGRVVMPLTSVFVEAAANTRDWHVDYFNSDGYRLDAGLLFEQGPGAHLKGEVWLGYMGQRYNGVTMQSISSLTYGVSLAAILGDNLTGVFQGSREAKEAALGLALLPSGALGASVTTCSVPDMAVCVSAIESLIGGRFDYRVSPNVVIGAGATYLEDEYEGQLAFGRVDRTLSPLVSLKYFVNPNVTLGLDYRYVDFMPRGGAAPAGFTSVNALSYTANVFLASVNAKW